MTELSWLGLVVVEKALAVWTLVFGATVKRYRFGLAVVASEGLAVTL